MQLDQVKRREFITLLGGAVAWPVGASAQQSAMPVVGFLRSTPSAPFQNLVVAFGQGLKEGYSITAAPRTRPLHARRFLEKWGGLLAVQPR